jgi:hypothetical protein
MKPDYTIGVPRSCKDVLQRPRGVCRDYATLFAGLARASVRSDPSGKTTRVLVVSINGRLTENVH